MIKSTLKISRYCPLVIQGFSNFLGLFQGIMANPFKVPVGDIAVVSDMLRLVCLGSFNIVNNRILKGPGLVIPPIFPKVP